MKISTHIARIIIAITFIFSGFVKLVDPIGSAIKFEEYFSEYVLNLPFLIPYALPFAIFLIIAELILGVKLLVGFKPKITTWAIAVLMLIFLFLTFYTATTGKVSDCGCFGDAIKLSPWGTFYKNVFFGALVLLLLFNLEYIKPWFGKAASIWIPFLSLIGSLWITFYVLNHLPIIDFRPFKVGNNIPENMEYKGNGEIPPIHDFFLENDTDDLTQTILEAPKAMLVISYDLDKSNLDLFEKIRPIAQEALDKGYLVYTISASSMDIYDEVKEMFKLPMDMLYCDETAIKTMIRANPGIMTIEKGTITGKWNASDIDQMVLK